jgi:hypothetical protein
LGIGAGERIAAEELKRVFQVQKRLDVSAPVVLKGNRLKEDLAETESGERNSAESRHKGFIGGDVKFLRLGKQVRVGGRRKEIVEERTCAFSETTH